MFLSETVDYIMSAKPILIAATNDVSNIIKNAQASAIARPDTTATIVEAINYLYHSSSSDFIQMEENSKKYYIDEMSLEKSCKKFIEVFKIVERKENSNV